MKNTFFNFIKISLMLVLLLQAGRVEAQNNLNMKAYRSGSVGPVSVDGTTLDQVFGTVTINGTVVTGNFNTFNGVYSGSTTLPTNVAGFEGAQVVFINFYGPNDTINYAQADALVAYVKSGGVLIGNMEGLIITPSGVKAAKYVSEALLCNSLTLFASDSAVSNWNPMSAFHPGNGALLLNNGAASLANSGTYAYVSGLPSENIVFGAKSASSCSTIWALEYVIPAYPGYSSNCGVNGMGLFSGEVYGILTVSTASRPVSNKNYAQLIYDFLYNPTAMATRRAWSHTASNINTSCAPAVLPCQVAPTLSATTATAACPANTVNLNSLVTSTLPSNNTLKWYSDNTHTTEVTTPTAVGVSGTYYAFYVDTVNNCYSPSAAVTVTANCPLNIATACPAVSLDLATRVTSTPAAGYVTTYHSATPATTANKLTSSVVTTGGTYYVASYFADQDCYTATSRPIVVTITNCCAVLGAPIILN